VVSTRALSIKALTELADDQPSSGPVDGDVRVDSGQLAGRVEVYQAKDGTWATICGTHAATKSCRANRQEVLPTPVQVS
jgi:hypothetical protein